RGHEQGPERDQGPAHRSHPLAAIDERHSSSPLSRALTFVAAGIVSFQRSLEFFSNSVSNRSICAVCAPRTRIGRGMAPAEARRVWSRALVEVALHSSRARRG